MTSSATANTPVRRASTGTTAFSRSRRISKGIAALALTRRISTGIAGALVLAAATAGAWAPPPITFDTPAKDDNGSMVLGNGELGVLAWLDAAGTLHTTLQNSDSWNEGGRHVKTGAIDYATGRPVDPGTFRQELSMERGEFEASWRSGGKPVSLRYRVQHGTDSIAACEISGAPAAEAKVVNWRLYPGGIKNFNVGEYGLGIRFVEGKQMRRGVNMEKKTFAISADRLVPGGWCHVNRNETVAEMMKIYDFYQATGDLGKKDILSNRVFGAVTRKAAGPKSSADGNGTDGGRVLFLSAVTCLHPCSGEDEWLRRTNETLDREGWTPAQEEAKRAEHVAAWREFWNRSHIEITPAAGAASISRRKADFKPNENLPTSFGVDSRGGNAFLGKFSFAEIEIGGKTVYSGVPKARDTIAGAADAAGKGGSAAGRANPPRFRFACRFATDRFEKPQRLLDNITPGKHDGFLVDVYKGRIRFVTGRDGFTHGKALQPGRETSLEISVPADGPVRIVVDGAAQEFQPKAETVARETSVLTLRYAAQRYLNACAARGRLPIRFNGSLFTMSHKGDRDYRRWGNGYWWQNTRLPYYTMFASGDLDMLAPLFDMYTGLLDFNMKRTRKYLGHGGAYFPECIQPWGDHFLATYGTKCEWKDRKDKLQSYGYHKYEWVGQLELSLLMLRWHAFTGNDAWLKEKALPSIREYVRFFDEHYPLDANGRYLMHPAQATEIWWDCTNPMPEIAGLRRVTEMLLALPEGILADEDRALFAKIRSRTPELPTRKLSENQSRRDGAEGTVFAPAEKFADEHNVETPELYCVFPFRLCSFEKPNAATGRLTYEKGRFHKLYFGWAQDEVNAAYLGMAEEAREHIADRALTHVSGKYRWPSFWGPNYNWVPDQDEGGIFLNTVQSMLLQYEGRRIFLAPAWPKDWNCSFKLHAPYGTTLEGRIEDGKVKDLAVTPESRRKDVEILL